MPSDGWVVLELTSRSESEDPEVVQKAILNALGGLVEVFLPAEVTEIGGDRVVHYLVGGYAFVRPLNPEKPPVYSKAENTRFVQSVLVGRHKEPAMVPDADIDRMRHQLKLEVDQGIGVGDTVMITTGAYRNIEAKVIEEIPERDEVQVYVQLRSKQAIVTLPRSGLSVVERAPFSPIYSRITALKVWANFVRPIVRFSSSARSLKSEFRAYRKVSGWLDRGHFLYANVTLDQYPGRLRQIRRQAKALSQVTEWNTDIRRLWTFVASYQGYCSRGQLSGLRGQLIELYWLDDILSRIQRLRREVEAIAHAAAARGTKKGKRGTMFQNLLIDGHNLALRCLYAPGLSDLTDSQGRPTGMIVGFLRSVGGLRKRYPDVRVYVAWDGSNERRKKTFPDYKGNRKSASESAPEGFDQLGFLRDMLPLIGVRQVTNPHEEADDVIASLVRGPLNDQNNLIFSSDRDLLQLVTESTWMLAPGMGGRKEVMYDPAAVKKSFGVAPKDVVQLRAFFGDTSDNIPGVPRVPKKVLRSLVQAHGTVEGVFASGLTGLTKSQYEKLRSSEPQVRINVGLMSLQDVDVTQRDPDVDADVAAKRLKGLDITPDPILAPFFGAKEPAVT